MSQYKFIYWKIRTWSRSSEFYSVCCVLFYFFSWLFKLGSEAYTTSVYFLCISVFARSVDFHSHWQIPSCSGRGQCFALKILKIDILSYKLMNCGPVIGFFTLPVLLYIRTLPNLVINLIHSANSRRCFSGFKRNWLLALVFPDPGLVSQQIYFIYSTVV